MYTEKYFGRQAIFHVFENDRTICIFTVLLVVVMVTSPPIVVMAAYTIQNSPLLLPFHLTDPVCDLLLPQISVLFPVVVCPPYVIKAVVHFGILALDLGLMSVGVLSMTFALNLMLEAMLTTMCIIKALR